MATHSSILAWKIPWAEEPDGLQWVFQRVGHDLAAKQQQHTPLTAASHVATPNCPGVESMPAAARKGEEVFGEHHLAYHNLEFHFFNLWSKIHG